MAIDRFNHAINSNATAVKIIQVKDIFESLCSEGKYLLPTIWEEMYSADLKQLNLAGFEFVCIEPVYVGTPELERKTFQVLFVVDGNE
jgi:hypothetical protein